MFNDLCRHAARDVAEISMEQRQHVVLLSQFDQSGPVNGCLKEQLFSA